LIINDVGAFCNRALEPFINMMLLNMAYNNLKSLIQKKGTREEGKSLEDMKT